MSNKDVINWAQCVERAGGEIELAQVMLAEFMAALPAEWASIEAHYKAKDKDALGKAIHQLHGACCYTGFQALKAAAFDLETALKTQAPIDAPYQAFANAIEQLMLAYKTFDTDA